MLASSAPGDQSSLFQVFDSRGVMALFSLTYSAASLNKRRHVNQCRGEKSIFLQEPGVSTFTTQINIYFELAQAI